MWVAEASMLKKGAVWTGAVSYRLTLWPGCPGTPRGSRVRGGGLVSAHSLSIACLVGFCGKTVWKLLDEMTVASS